MVVLSTCYAKAAAFRVIFGVILGAPASGKGTVSSRIIKDFNVAHISSGDKLRLHVAKETELGKKVKNHMDSGSLVPDDIMISLISNEIKNVGPRNWFLDGFPRTVEQAKKLQKIHPVNFVLNLKVPFSVILERVQNRWVHLPSGRVYNIGFNDPKVPGKDDITGEDLSKRPDDRLEVVEKRLEHYKQMTEPVIEYYKKIGILHEFSGNTTDSMWPQIKDCIGQFTKT